MHISLLVTIKVFQQACVLSAGKTPLNHSHLAFSATLLSSISYAACSKKSPAQTITHTAHSAQLSSNCIRLTAQHRNNEKQDTGIVAVLYPLCRVMWRDQQQQQHQRRCGVGENIAPPQHHIRAAARRMGAGHSEDGPSCAAAVTRCTHHHTPCSDSSYQ